jgi:hypothetical protein
VQIAVARFVSIAEALIAAVSHLALNSAIAASRLAAYSQSSADCGDRQAIAHLRAVMRGGARLNTDSGICLFLWSGLEFPNQCR